jgi:hypothetical protein
MMADGLFAGRFLCIAKECFSGYTNFIPPSLVILYMKIVINKRGCRVIHLADIAVSPSLARENVSKGEIRTGY